MKPQYTLFYDCPPARTLRKLPADTAFRLEQATQTQHLAFGSADMLTQALTAPPFHIELLEIRCSEGFEFGYRIKEPRPMLVAVLQGAVTTCTPEGLFSSYGRQHHLQLTHSTRGRFKAKTGAGTHVVLCISLQPDWLAFAGIDLPVVVTYLQEYARGAVLPYCRMPQPMRTDLQDMLLKLPAGTASEGYYHNCLSALLKNYDALAAKKINRETFRIRAYLHEHYCNPQLSPDSLAEAFGKTERTLRDKFLREYNITPRDYYTTLRVQKALRLIRKEKMKKKDIYLITGFNDENTLRLTLRKFGIR